MIGVRDGRRDVQQLGNSTDAILGKIQRRTGCNRDDSITAKWRKD